MARLAEQHEIIHFSNLHKLAKASYQLTKKEAFENNQIQIPAKDKTGFYRLCDFNIRKIQTDNQGIQGAILTSKDSNTVHVIYAGVHSYESARICFESSVARESFAAEKKIIMDQVFSAIKEDLSDCHEEVEMVFNGHSLGAVLASYTLIATQERLVKNELHPDINHRITKLTLCAMSAPGISQRFVNEAEYYAEILCSREEQPVEHSAFYVIVAGDPIQTAGASCIGVNSNFFRVHLLKYYDFLFVEGFYKKLLLSIIIAASFSFLFYINFFITFIVAEIFLSLYPGYVAHFPKTFENFIKNSESGSFKLYENHDHETSTELGYKFRGSVGADLLFTRLYPNNPADKLNHAKPAQLAQPF